LLLSVSPSLTFSRLSPLHRFQSALLPFSFIFMKKVKSVASLQRPNSVGNACVLLALMLVVLAAFTELHENGPADGLRAVVPEKAYLFLGTCVFAFEVPNARTGVYDDECANPNRPMHPVLFVYSSTQFLFPSICARPLYYFLLLLSGCSVSDPPHCLFTSALRPSSLPQGAKYAHQQPSCSPFRRS
jgi:hypothetical protein